MLTRDEQATLLQSARRALEAHLRRQPPPDRERGGMLEAPLSAFVTLHRLGELRGCLGRLDVAAPLGQTIVELAAIAADSDPRFNPVEAGELAEIDIEISVLAPEEAMRSIEQIEIGRHGLIVERGSRRGLLLPQVASERGWDRETFLSHTCLKAGLPEDDWRYGARVLLFEALVFGEKIKA
jgi:AmmeMemoRadiSam system protein A